MSPSTPAGLVIVAVLYRAVYRDTITGSDPTDLYRQLRDQPEAAFFPVQTTSLLRADMQATWLVSVMSARVRTVAWHSNPSTDLATVHSWFLSTLPGEVGASA